MWRSLSLLTSDVRSLGIGAALKIRFGGSFSRVIELDVAGLGKVSLRPPESDLDVVRQILRDRQYEVTNRSAAERLRTRYDEIVRSGGHPIIVDAGANIGISSMWFSSVWPAATILALEPDDGNHDMLVRNTASWPRIVALKAAIGAEAGFVDTVRAGLGWAVITERSEDGCPAITIADAVRHVPHGMLFIVKVDIEGFEDDLFASNLDWMDEAIAVFVEPHDWLFPERRTSRAFQAAFGQRDFSLIIMGENLLYLRN